MRLRAKIRASIRYGVFLGTVFLFTPWTVTSTLLANSEIEKLDQGEAVCIRNRGFGLFALVFLVLNYVMLLIIILQSFKAFLSMRRYFHRLDPLPRKSCILCCRSWNDMVEAFEFASFLQVLGRYSYGFERRYLLRALKRRHFAGLKDRIVSQVYYRPTPSHINSNG